MKHSIKSHFFDWFSGLLLSYSQVFFSKSKIFSWFILIITFTYPELGICGMIASLSALVFASIIGLNNTYIRNGYYAYNALLVGLGIGYYYELNLPVLVVIVLAGFITLLLHLWIEQWLYKYRLPVLSLPFVITLWFVILSTRELAFFELSDRNLFVLNNIFALGGQNLLSFYTWFNDEFLPPLFKYFFTALGSIFFQDTALAGFVIFIGLIVFSRIASFLAILGFFSAYYFMHFIGIQNEHIGLMFIGFNFILTSIAIGGIFIIPNLYSHLWILILTPVNVLLTISLSSMLQNWQLSIYSLSFNLIILMFLTSIRSRYKGNRKLIETYYQEYMPEKNLYSYLASKGKEINSGPVLLLPFWGEWTVWQGYNGNYTHKDLYRHALDFVITYQGKNYKGNGATLDDYYTYNKLVVSPGSGWVVRIVDGIEDNPIGEVNLIHNWGNSIIIKHSEYVYSQMSHLKAGSFKVKEGDYVRVGQPLAHVGNSGRSPEPHLHFQVQAYPMLGSPTIEYTISRYLLIEGKNKKLLYKTVPSEQDHVENIQIQSNLAKALHFIPGTQIEVTLHENMRITKYDWEVFTDSLNQTYIYSKTTHSYAYIYKDDLMFYFRSFHGKKTDPLYLLYCSCYHIEFAVLPEQKFTQPYPLHLIFPFYKTFWQDVFAPFYNILKAIYSIKILSNSYSSNSIIIESNMHKKIWIKEYLFAKATITIVQQKITKIEWYDKNQKTVYLTYKNKY